MQIEIQVANSLKVHLKHLICNLTSKHSIGANCEENTEGTTLAFSYLLNLSEILKNMDNATEIDTVDCTEPAIPSISTNQKIIDENKVVTISKRNKNIAQCEECSHNLMDPQTLSSIKHAIEILDLKFIEICYETNLFEKRRKF